MLAFLSRPPSTVVKKLQIVGPGKSFAVDVDGGGFLAKFLEPHEAGEDERVGDLFHVRGLE